MNSLKNHKKNQQLKNLNEALLSFTTNVSGPSLIDHWCKEALLSLTINLRGTFSY